MAQGLRSGSGAGGSTGGGGGSGQINRSSPYRRRRLSRGLIAAGNRAGGVGSSNDASSTNNNPRAGDESSNDTNNADNSNAQGNAVGGNPPTVGAGGINAPPPSNSTGSNGGGGPASSIPNANAASTSSASLSSRGGKNANNPMALPTLPKPNYSGRIALACVRNALEKGVITKYSLCPGKARKTLVTKAKASRDRNKASSPRRQRGNATTTTTTTASDRAEEAFLQNPPYRGADGDGEEEYSSGDDDDHDASIDDPNNAGGTSSSSSGLNLNNAALHESLRTKEPYFVPTGTDAASMGLQGGQVPGMTGARLPFNYRKLRYFDLVTASDRAVARRHLQGEIVDAKKLRSKALGERLRSMQRLERERVEREKTGDVAMKNVEEGMSGTLDLEAERRALATSLSRFPHELTPTLSAACLIESLAMNHHESIEGMAKCYDGIVSAGTALLDLANDTIPTGSKPKLTTAEIMGALAPLLITTLEQSSGEVLVKLAELRNYCGTRRYQRRFVQRVAPSLVRPPNAAMWCLRHQSDIEPIIAAVEMILDNADQVFSMGWHERGRSLLKEDTQRAETLRTAASQLRRLNTSPTSSEGGLLVGLSPTPGSQVHRGRNSLGKKDGGCLNISVTNDSLAEWEVEAVDENIRRSVLNVFSRDWSRISTLNLMPKENANETTPFGSSRSSRRGISTAKSKEWTDASSVSSGGDRASTSSSQVSGMNSALLKSPRSLSSKLPLSPRNSQSNIAAPNNPPVLQLPSADALESAFGPSFSQSMMLDDGTGGNSNELIRPVSPTEYPVVPPTPLSPTREAKTSSSPKTPPTLHHYHDIRNDDRISMPSFSDTPPQHTSPSRGSSMGMSAPLSPGGASTSSMGTVRSSASTTAQMTSATSTRDQYRALTSTASERKRTVAACRALRAQITQFEEAFMQMHNRAPKKAAERAPLASTYMQYREWKRAIRADAACRIQALCRGARSRSVLASGGELKMRRYMERQREEKKRRKLQLLSLRKLSMEDDDDLPSPVTSPKPPNHLSIPLDMGGDEGESSTGLPLTRTRLETRTAGDDSVEVEMVPVLAPPPSVSPRWRERDNRQQQQQPQHQRNQQQPQQQPQPPIASPPSTSPREPSPSSSHTGHKSSRSHRSSSSISLPDVSVMSLAELQQRKRELKQQLKIYDMNFHAQHSRMPEKREKEPIRHLYESYNAYKNQISTIEKGEAQPGPGTAAFRGVGEAPAVERSSSDAENSVSPKAATSPKYGGPSGSSSTSPGPGHYKRSSSGGTSGGGSSLDASSMTEIHTAASNEGEKSHGDGSSLASTAAASASSAGAASSSEVSSQDLASLKAEKAQLHQMLRSYEKEFFKREKRQVSSFQDIRPVASQYRRYKEIKKAIAQKSASSSSSS